MDNNWSKSDYLARISDFHSRKRHRGGSPDNIEISAYKKALYRNQHSKTCVVLGMTPELRNMAADYFEQLITIDKNAAAIEVYSEWLDAEKKKRELIIQADWFAALLNLHKPVNAIMGDGIFGNLTNIELHHKLLSAISNALEPNGIFLTRKAVIPREFNPQEHAASRLLKSFREGKIDAAEFGFGTRLVGHYSTCYDPQTHILDNAKVFDICDEAYKTGKLHKNEYSAILRYSFRGRNCILTQDIWEQTLSDEQFSFKIHRCKGKSWYDYYIIYECRPKK